MINDQIIYISWVHQLLDMVDQFIQMAFLDRVEKGNLLILDQEGIICCSFVGGIAVKIPDIPVNGSHPENFIFNFRGIHVLSLLHIRYQDLRPASGQKKIGATVTAIAILTVQTDPNCNKPRAVFTLLPA
jgi:hypothetical protein